MLRTSLVMLRWRIKITNHLFEVVEWLKYKPMEKVPMWHREPLGIFFLYIFTSLLWYWTFVIPSPGKAVGTLAVAAAVMSVRGEMGGKEKLAWSLLLFAFLFVELRSIDTERAANAEVQNAARLEDQLNFEKVLQVNQRDFAQTMAQFGVTTSKLQGMNEDNRGAQRRERKEFSGLLTQEGELFTHEEQLAESLNGKLVPGSEPTPPYGNCPPFDPVTRQSGMPFGKDSVRVFLGAEEHENIVIIDRFPHAFVGVGGKPAISLDRDINGSVFVTMDIRGSDRKLIARLNKDGFVVNRNNLLEMRKDKNSLSVIDEYGNEVLRVHYYNPNAISINGALPSANGMIAIEPFPRLDHVCLGEGDALDLNYD